MRTRLFIGSTTLLLSFIASAGLGLPTPAMALEREFPVNSRVVRIQSINEPYLVAGGKTYLLPPGALIFNENNMTIVRGALPPGVTARIQLDLNGDVRRIWILNPEEIAAPTRPKEIPQQTAP